MAIYRKERLEPYLQELEAYYWALRRAVEGVAPNENLAEHYLVNPEQFRREFREVDIDLVLRQIEHFKATAANLKQLRSRAHKLSRQ
ncbi:hypothetical protein [Thiocystis violascens]|uniref:Uncharacterized protein n=1 Tax=Thiocystis violascens (strain ATCC 17096 / DSM 198 / 6111) TaxID=765911 RepID=I3YGU1_THIV6|nr:hypothetical protein [Thiocystis violascens]AFL76209.1 hypothetical protein Thivi_4406 [Thiocystis violascens DSM 198]